MKSGIYKITNIITNKFYIGSAVILEKRKCEHFSCLRKQNHINKHLQNAFNKHGESNFIFEVLEEVQDKTELIEREQHYLDTLLFAQEYIATNKKDNRFLMIGYNICPTAGNTLGRDVYWEVWNKGKKHTEIHKQRQSKAWERRKIEKPYSIETREKMSKSISEARKKPEVIKRYQEALSKRKLIKYPHCDYTSKNIGSLKSVHFDNCLKNPNLDIKALLEKKRLIKLKIKAIKNSNKLNINS